jgi:hypothetical protein
MTTPTSTPLSVDAHDAKSWILSALSWQIDGRPDKARECIAHLNLVDAQHAVAAVAGLRLQVADRYIALAAEAILTPDAEVTG